MEVGKKEVGKKEVAREGVGKMEVGKKEVGKKEVGKKGVAREGVGKKEVGKKGVAREGVGKKEVGKKEVGREGVLMPQVGVVVAVVLLGVGTGGTITTVMIAAKKIPLKVILNKAIILRASQKARGKRQIMRRVRRSTVVWVWSNMKMPRQHLLRQRKQQTAIPNPLATSGAFRRYMYPPLLIIL